MPVTREDTRIGLIEHLGPLRILGIDTFDWIEEKQEGELSASAIGFG
jgi:hypothetical protein